MSSAEPPQPPRQASPATPPQEGNVPMQTLFQQSHVSPPLQVVIVNLVAHSGYVWAITVLFQQPRFEALVITGWHSKFHRTPSQRLPLPQSNLEYRVRYSTTNVDDMYSPHRANSKVSQGATLSMMCIDLLKSQA